MTAINGCAQVIDSIYHSFSNCRLDEEFTLLEWSFFDTHYRHTVEIDNQYLSNYGASPDQILIDLKKDYVDYYSKILVKAVNCRERTKEYRDSWDKISFNYFYFFSSDTSYLSSKAFKFYLPAAMAIYIDCLKANEDSHYFYYFLSRLEHFYNEDLAIFNKRQLRAITDFLIFYQKNQMSLQEFNDIEYLIKNYHRLAN